MAVCARQEDYGSKRANHEGRARGQRTRQSMTVTHSMRKVIFVRWRIKLPGVKVPWTQNMRRSSRCTRLLRIAGDVDVMEHEQHHLLPRAPSELNFISSQNYFFPAALRAFDFNE